MTIFTNLRLLLAPLVLLLGLAAPAAADDGTPAPGGGASAGGLALRSTIDATSADGHGPLRGLNAQLVAHWSTVPGLSLLEGDPAALAKREQEIQLSNGGLTDPESRVRDRMLKADVTVTLRALVRDAASGAFRVKASVEGPAGRRDVEAPAAIEDLGFALDEAVAAVVGDPERAAAFQQDCLGPEIRVERLATEACVQAIVRRCAASAATPRERLVCLARRGHEIATWAKQADRKPDLHVAPSADEAAALAVLKTGARPDDAAMAHLTAYMARVQAFDARVKEVMGLLRPRFAAAMEAIIQAAPPLVVDAAGGTPITAVRIAAARWDRMDPGPMVLLDVAANPGSREVVREVGGEERTVTEDVHSFGFRGLGEGGKVFEYRLLCLGRGPTDCNVQTSLPPDYFARTGSVLWFEPDWRPRR